MKRAQQSMDQNDMLKFLASIFVTRCKNAPIFNTCKGRKGQTKLWWQKIWWTVTAKADTDYFNLVPKGEWGLWYNFLETISKKTRANLDEYSITSVSSVPPNFWNSNSPRKTHQQTQNLFGILAQKNSETKKKQLSSIWKGQKLGNRWVHPRPRRLLPVSVSWDVIYGSLVSLRPFTPSLHHQQPAVTGCRCRWISRNIFVGHSAPTYSFCWDAVFASQLVPRKGFC